MPCLCITSCTGLGGDVTAKDGEDDDEDIPELDGGSSMAIERMEELADLDGMTVGE